MARVGLAALSLMLTAGTASASHGPGVSEGTAGLMMRAIAAAMASFPPVAVTVFALARLLGFGR